jgi:hypothetical protein
MVNGRGVNYDATLCFVSGQSIWDNVSAIGNMLGNTFGNLGDMLGIW